MMNISLWNIYTQTINSQMPFKYMFHKSHIVFRYTFYGRRWHKLEWKLFGYVKNYFFVLFVSLGLYCLWFFNVNYLWKWNINFIFEVFQLSMILWKSKCTNCHHYIDDIIKVLRTGNQIYRELHQIKGRSVVTVKDEISDISCKDTQYTRKIETYRIINRIIISTCL